MGFELSSLAIPSSFEDVALDALGLSVEDNEEEPFTTTILRRYAKWSIVIEESARPMSLGDNKAAAISSSCPVVVCSLDEHIMKSRAVLWEHGTLKWEVQYDSSTGAPKTNVTCNALRLVSVQSLNDLDRLQVNVGFEVPIDKAEEVTGFRHDCPELNLGIPLFFSSLDAPI